MGLVEFNEAVNGLNGSLKYLREHIGHMINKTVTNMEEAYLTVIVLGLYLYSKYYKCGDKQEDTNKYSVTAHTVKSLYALHDDTIASFVVKIVRARNTAAHATWNEYANADVMDIINSDLLIRFLRCEGIVDKNLNFIEPKGGKYKSVSDIDEAHELIKIMVDRIDTEDKEKDKKKSTGVLHAASTMGD